MDHLPLNSSSRKKLGEAMNLTFSLHAFPPDHHQISPPPQKKGMCKPAMAYRYSDIAKILVSSNVQEIKKVSLNTVLR